jgi:hypothetical protein
MASRGRSPTCIQEERERIAKERGEPIDTVQRTVVELDNGTLYGNLPPVARKVLDIDRDSDIEVSTHDDRIVIRPIDDQGHGQ